MNEFDIFRNERIHSAGGRAVQAYYGYISCPSCGSKDVEPSWAHEGYMQCNNCGEEWLHPRGKTVKSGRKVVTTTHGRYPVSGLANDATIMLMMMPYEKLVSVHDSTTGKLIKKARKKKRRTNKKKRTTNRNRR